MRLKVFSADWCGPCTQQHEILEDFDTVPVEYVDVDENPDEANEFSVRSVPTLVLLEGGEVEAQFTGLTQLDQIEAAIESE